ETVALDHVLDDASVTRLLERLQLERLTDCRIRLQRGARAYHRAGVLLGLERMRPEGKATEQREGLVVEHRPLELLGLVGPMLGQKRPAEELLVRRRPDLHGSVQQKPLAIAAVSLVLFVGVQAELRERVYVRAV